MQKCEKKLLKNLQPYAYFDTCVKGDLTILVNAEHGKYRDGFF